MLAELGDIDVHRTCVEVIIVDPDGLEREVTFKDLVDMGTEQTEELGFLGGKFGHLIVDQEHLLLSIECELTYLVHCEFLALLALDATENGFDTEHEFLHREGFGDIVVGTDFEAFENVFLD